MTRRLRSVRRVLEVQRDLQRLEEQRLRELRQREAELEAAQDSLIRTLADQEDGGTGRFAEVMAGQVGRLAGKAHAVAASRARQTQVVLQETGRLRRVEKVEDTLTVEDGRQQDRKLQNEIGELFATRGNARLR